MFIPQADPYATLDLGQLNSVQFPASDSGSFTGTINVNYSSPGYATISTSDLADSWLKSCLEAAGQNTVQIECAGHYPGDTTNSAGANPLSGGVKHYRVNWSTSAMDGSGNIGINWTIQFSDDTNYNVTWTHHTDTIDWDWDIHYINAGNDVSYSASSNSSINGVATISDTESRVAWDAGASNSIISSMTAIMKSNSYPTMFGGYSGAKNGVLSGKVPSTISGIGSDSGTRVYNWDTANHTQIYRRDLTAYRQANTYLSINKITLAGYEAFVAGNPNYSLAGTRFEVYSDAPCTNHLGTIDINADGSSNTLTLSAAYANSNVYLKETIAGHGYKLNPAVIPVTLNAAGQTTTATLSNSPAVDPAFIELTKVSSVSGTTTFNGSMLANNAEYTVEQYYNSADALATSNKGRTWVYSTKNSSTISTANQDKLLKDISDAPYLKPGDDKPQFPLGTYRIYESKAPTDSNGVETGLELSTHVYYVTLEMNADGLRVDKTIYKDGIDAGHRLSTLTIEDEATPAADLAAEETEVWHPIGLLKVDSDKHAALPGYTTATIPQGDATYVGAKFYVYTTDTNIFAATTAGLYQGHTYTIDGLNRICVDGVPLSIVTGTDGFGATLYPLPYATTYYVKEYEAPVGYVLNPNNLPVSSVWTTNGGQMIGLAYDTFTYAGVATLAGDGTAVDDVVRGSITVTKTDMSTGTRQGDTSFAGIRYAVVNNSANSVILGTTEYAVGEVVAIITTDASGSGSLAGVPYGRYTVYELRQDATISAGDVYAGSTELGTSIYANSSYIFSDSYDGALIASQDNYEVTPVLHAIVDNGVFNYSFDNAPVRGSINVRKYNAETDTQVNQGINSLSGIRYAYVNRSALAVNYKAVNYPVGTVIDITTTDISGNCGITDVPYGTYDIYELRQDATITIGEVYNGSAKLGTSIYANNYYIYADNMTTKVINQATPTYTVDFVHDSIRTAGETRTEKFSDAPIRGDVQINKYDIDGHTMAYIPFLISSLDADGDIIESHVIVADQFGVINTKTRNNKTAATVNTLDGYYNSATNSYSGPLDAAAGSVNIWFGNISQYFSPTVVTNNRGSCLVGNYRIQELQCATNLGQDMLTSEFSVTEDKTTVLPGNILVDLNISMDSVAWDTTSDSNSLTIGPNTEVTDTLSITHLKVTTDYRVMTEAINVRKDGSTVSLGTSGYVPFNVTSTDGTQTATKEMTVKFNIDTTGLQQGSYVALVDRVYARVNGVWSATPIASHNTFYNVQSQMLYVPDISTNAINTTTNSTIGSISPSTVANDTISYSHLGNKTNYTINIKLVDDSGNIIKDVANNNCEKSVKLYTDDARSISVRNNNGTLVGPTSATFSMANVMVEPFNVASGNYSNAHFIVSITDDWTGNVVITHNQNLADNNETISWLQISTDAGSSTGYSNIIPNSTSAVLVDTINYSNNVANTTVRIDGTVIDKTTGNVVTSNSKTVSISAGSGTTNLSFTFDSTPYAGKELVVYEKIYMVVNGRDVLIADHSDINDTRQTVIVPDIQTKLVSVNNGAEYKIVSKEYEDVTLIDYVTYSGLKAGESWTLTATLMNKNTNSPVLDADGHNVTATHTFTPSSTSGTEPVTITFKQQLTSETWEIDNSWVCFEDLKSNTVGHTNYSFAVHNDLNDKNQTVYLPKFKTTATNADGGFKRVLATTNQKVNDAVELKNFDKATQSGDVFTLQIEAHDALTGNPLVDKDGNVFTNTKTFTYTGQTVENIEITFDATGLNGRTIVFYEKLFYGNTTNSNALVLVENDKSNADQSVSIPTINTVATDHETGTKTLSMNRRIVDEIFLDGIFADTDYEIVTKVVDKATGEFIKDKDGKELELITPYRSPKSPIGISTVSATTSVTIDLSSAVNIEGKTLVIYEYIRLNGMLYVIDADINNLNQTVIVPGVTTRAYDTFDNDNVIDGTKTEQTIIDEVSYTNLLVGETYTVTGKLVIKPKDITNTNYEYVTDETGKPLEVSVTFVAEQSSGKIQVPFTIDASKYAGKKLVAFEEIKYGDVDMAAHMDITDKEQTITVSLLLHVKIAKADADNIKYYLKGAEITIFNADGTIAKDINGVDCIGITDVNGEVNFTVLYDDTNTFYAKETKAPTGYGICNDKFEIVPSEDRESLGTCLIKINILDKILIIPPVPITDDSIPFIIIVLFLILSILGTIGILVTRNKTQITETEDIASDSNLLVSAELIDDYVDILDDPDDPIDMLNDPSPENDDGDTGDETDTSAYSDDYNQ